jgi:abequosyltransferase
MPQMVDGVEVVILDGGSTDNTPDVVGGFRERYPELRYERRPERGGIDRDLARTVGLARGDYAWLFCSDDVMKPGAIEAMLGHIASGRDVYVCGVTLCTRDMRVIGDHAVAALPADAEFDLGDPADRRRYFESALTTTAFFSFAGSLILSKARWDTRTIDEDFVGSCWAHVARFFSMVPEGLTLGYLSTSYLYKRSDNDSFMDDGLIRRYALAIDGYHRLAATFFAEQSLEARHVRRSVANEFPPYVLLEAKSNAPAERPEDVPLLNRLAAKAYVDPSLRNRVRHLTYRYTPLFAFRWARFTFRALKSARTALRRR